MKQFRFQDLEIWKRAVAVGLKLFDVADDLEKRRQFRCAEQLRAAALSISNNIAEGSGSSSDKDFAHFLNIAKRSAFENANMLLFFTQAALIADKTSQPLVNELEEICRMIEAFRKHLRS